MTNRGWLRRDVARQTPSSRSLQIPEESSPSLPSPIEPAASNKPGSVIEPAWGKVTASTSPLSRHSPVTAYSKVDGDDYPALSLPVKAHKRAPIASDAPAVQPPAENENVSLRGPERAITPDNGTRDAHPIVSQKKAKKAQREAKRKAKKVSSAEETTSPTAMEESGLKGVEQSFAETLLGSPMASSSSHALDEVPAQSSISRARKPIDGAKVDASIVAAVEQDTDLDVPTESSPSGISYTTDGKHDHWMRFSRVFVVDQLTVPLLQPFENCSHGSSCRFESHGIPDCPFHEPRRLCVASTRCVC